MKTHCSTTGDGSPIIYLHGWGCDGSVFATVASNLPNYRNYMLDFYGFGQSSVPPASGYTVFDYANQLVEFLNERNLADVVIVAHSFGCRIAMIVAANHPNLINRMLLFAPAGLRRFSLVRWCKVRYYKLRKRWGFVDATKYASADYQNASPALKNTFVKVVNCDLSLYAKRIKCKTLIIAAKADTAVPLKDAKRLHRLIKGSDFVTVNGDHFALFYSPASFAKIINIFTEE